LGVEEQLHDTKGRPRNGMSDARALYAVTVLAGDVGRDIDAAADQFAHPGGRFRYRAVDQTVPGRSATPMLVKAFHDDPVIAQPLNHFERAGADGLLGKSLPAHLIHICLGLDARSDSADPV